MSTLSLSRQEIIFADVTNGADYSDVVIVQNASNRIHTIKIIPPTLSNFQIQSKGPSSLSPGMQCTIKVKFCCKEYREFHDYITVLCDDGSEYKIKLSAYIRIPEIGCSGLVNFGIVQCGVDADQQIEIFNNGGMDGVLRLDFKQDESADDKDIAELTYDPADVLIPAHSSRKITLRLKTVGEGVFRKIVNAFLFPQVAVEEEDESQPGNAMEAEAFQAVNEVVSMFPHRLSAIIDVNATSQIPHVHIAPRGSTSSVCMLWEAQDLVYDVVNESGVPATFSLTPFVIPVVGSSAYARSRVDTRSRVFFRYVEFSPSFGVVAPMSSSPVVVSFKPAPDGQGPDGCSYVKMDTAWRFSSQVDVDEFIRLVADFIDKEVVAIDNQPQDGAILSLQSVPPQLGEASPESQLYIKTPSTLLSRLNLGEASLDNIGKEASGLGDSLDFSLNKTMRSRPGFLSIQPLPPIGNLTHITKTPNPPTNPSRREGGVIERCIKMINTANSNRSKGVVDCNEVDEGLLNPGESIVSGDQPIDVSDENNLNIRRVLGTYVIQERGSIMLRCSVNGPTQMTGGEQTSSSTTISLLARNKSGGSNSMAEQTPTNHQYEVCSQLDVVCFVPVLLLSHQKLVFGCSRIDVFNPSGFSQRGKDPKTVSPSCCQKELRRINFQIRSFSSQGVWVTVQAHAPFSLLFSDSTSFLSPSQTLTVPVVYNPKTVGVHKGSLAIAVSGTKQGLKTPHYVANIPLVGCAIFDDNERVKERENMKNKDLETFKKQLVREKQQKFLLETLLRSDRGQTSAESTGGPRPQDGEAAKLVKEYNRLFLPPPETLTTDELEKANEKFQGGRYIVLPSDRPSVRLREMEVAVLGAAPERIEQRKRRFINQLNGAGQSGGKGQFLITDALDSSNCLDDPTTLAQGRSSICPHAPSLVAPKERRRKQRQADNGSNGLSEPEPFTEEELKGEYGSGKVWCTSDEIGKGVSTQSLSKIVRINKKIHNNREPATTKTFPDIVDVVKAPELSQISVIMSERSRFLSSSKMTQGAKETLYLNLQTTGKQSDGPALITVLKYFGSLDLDMDGPGGEGINGLELTTKAGARLLGAAAASAAATGLNSAARPLNPNTLNTTQLEQMTRKEIELYRKTNGSGMSLSSNHVIFEQCAQLVPSGSLCTFKINLELNSPGSYFEQFIVLINGSTTNKLTLCEDNNGNKGEASQHRAGGQMYNKEHPNVITVSGKVGECRLKVFDENYTYIDTASPTPMGDAPQGRLIISTKASASGDEYVTKTITLRNPGDVEVGFKIRLDKTANEKDLRLARNTVTITKGMKGFSDDRKPRLQTQQPLRVGAKAKGKQEVTEQSQGSLVLSQLEEELFAIPAVGLISPFSELSVTLKWIPRARPYEVNELPNINPNNLFKHTLVENYQLKIDVARQRLVTLPLETHLLPALLQFGAAGLDSPTEATRDASHREQTSVWGQGEDTTALGPKTTGRTTERQSSGARPNRRQFSELNLGYVNYGSTETYSFVLSNPWETSAYFALSYGGSNLYGGTKQLKLPKSVSAEDIQSLFVFDNPSGTVKGHSSKTISFAIKPKKSLAENIQLDEFFTITVRGGIPLRLRLRFMLTVPKVSILTKIAGAAEEVSPNGEPKPLLNLANTPLFSTRFQDIFLTNSGYSPTTIHLDINSVSPTASAPPNDLASLGDLFFHLDRKDKAIDIGSSCVSNQTSFNPMHQLGPTKGSGGNEATNRQSIGQTRQDAQFTGQPRAVGSSNDTRMQTGIPPKLLRRLRKKLINVDKVLGGNMETLMKFGVLNSNDVASMLKELKTSDRTHNGITRRMLVDALDTLNLIIMDAEYVRSGSRDEGGGLAGLVAAITERFGLSNISNFIEVHQHRAPAQSKTVMNSAAVSNMQRELLERAIGSSNQEKNQKRPEDSLALYKALTVKIQPNETKKLSVCFCPSNPNHVNRESLDLSALSESDLVGRATAKLSVAVTNTNIEWPIWILASVAHPTVYTDTKAINLGVLSASNGRATGTQLSSENMQRIRLFNRTNIEYRFSVHLDDDTSGSASPFLIQDSFGIIRTAPRDSTDIRIALQPIEGFHFSKIIIECVPDASQAISQNNPLEPINITVPISCCFLRPYIHVPKLYLPVTPVNTPSVATSFIYNIGYNDITVSVCGLNNAHPDLTPFSTEACVDTLDVPLVLSFPWGTKLNKMVRRIPINVFCVASRPTDFDIVIKLGVVDNSVASGKDVYDLRVVGGCCNSRVYSEEMFANSNRGSIFVAISRCLVLSSQQQDEDAVTRLDNNRVALASNINNNYYKFSDAESGIEINNGCLSHRLDDGITPTIEYILSLPQSNGMTAAAREIMEKVGIGSTDEFYDLRLALQSLNTSSYVYINAAATKLGISPDFLSNSENRLCNFLYGNVERSRGKTVIDQSEDTKTQNKSGRQVEAGREKSKRQISNLFVHNKTLDTAYDAAKKETGATTGDAGTGKERKLTAAALNNSRYITHSVLFGPAVLYRPSLITDLLVKLLTHLNNFTNSTGSRQTLVSEGQPQSGQTCMPNTPNNPILYLPDIPYAGPGSTVTSENCGRDINYTILDSYVQYLMGTGMDVLSDPDASVGESSIYLWDVGRFIRFINQLSGRRLFNIKPADLRRRAADAPGISSDPIASVISFQSIRDTLVKAGCLVNSIELLFLEPFAVFRERVIQAFRGRNGIKGDADRANSLVNDDVLGVLDTLLSYVYQANHKQAVARLVSEIIRVFVISRLPIPITKKQQQQRPIKRETAVGTGGTALGFVTVEEGSVYSKQEAFLLQWAEQQRNQICEYLRIEGIPQLKTHLSNFDTDFSDLFVILCILTQHCPHERRLYLALYHHFFSYQTNQRLPGLQSASRIEGMSAEHNEHGGNQQSSTESSRPSSGREKPQSQTFDKLLVNERPPVVLGQRSVGVYPAANESPGMSGSAGCEETGEEKHFLNIPDRLGDTDVNHQQQEELRVVFTPDTMEDEGDTSQGRQRITDAVLREFLDANTDEKVRFLGRLSTISSLIIKIFRRIGFGVNLDRNSMIMMNSANRIILLALLHGHLVNSAPKQPSPLASNVASGVSTTNQPSIGSTTESVMFKNNIKTLMENCDLIIQMESEIGSTKDQKIVLRTTQKKQPKNPNSPGGAEATQDGLSTCYKVVISPIYDNDPDELMSMIRNGAMSRNKKALFKRADEVSLVGTDEAGRLLVRNYFSTKDSRQKSGATSEQPSPDAGQPNKSPSSEQTQPSLVVRYSPKFSTAIPTLVTMSPVAGQTGPRTSSIPSKPMLFLVLPRCTKIGSTSTCCFHSKLYKPTSIEVPIDNQAKEEALVTLRIARATERNDTSPAGSHFAVECLFLQPHSQKILAKLNPTKTPSLLGSSRQGDAVSPRSESAGFHTPRKEKSADTYDIILPANGLTLEFVFLPFHPIQERYTISVVDRIRGVWCKEIILDTDTDDVVHFKSEVNSYCNSRIDQAIPIPFNNAILRRLVQTNTGALSPIGTSPGAMSLSGGNSTVGSNTGVNGSIAGTSLGLARNKSSANLAGPGLALNSSLLLSAMMKEESIRYSITTDADFIRCPQYLILWNTNKLIGPNSASDTNSMARRNQGEFTNNTLVFSLCCTEPGVYNGTIVLTSKYDTRIYNLTANVFDKPNSVNMEIEAAVGRQVIQVVPVTGPPNTMMRLELSEAQVEIVDNGVNKLRVALAGVASSQRAVRIEPSETTISEMFRMLELPATVQIGPNGRGEFTLRLRPTAICNFATRIYISNSLIDVPQSAQPQVDPTSSHGSRAKLGNSSNMSFQASLEPEAIPPTLTSSSSVALLAPPVSLNKTATMAKAASFYTVSVSVTEPEAIDKVRIECEAHQNHQQVINLNIRTEDLYLLLGVDKSTLSSTTTTNCLCFCDVPFVHVQDTIPIPVKASPGLTTTVKLPITAFSHVSGHTTGRIFLFPSPTQTTGESSGGEQLVRTNHFLFCEISFSVRTTKSVNSTPIEIRCPVGQTVSTFIPVSVGDEELPGQVSDGLATSFVFSVTFVGEGLSGDDSLVIGGHGRRDKTRYCLRYSPISMAKTQLPGSGHLPLDTGGTEEANGLVIFNHRTLGSFAFALRLIPLPPTPQRIPAVRAGVGGRAEILCCSVPALIASDLGRTMPPSAADSRVWHWKVVELEEPGTEDGHRIGGHVGDRSISINGFSFDSDMPTPGLQLRPEDEQAKRELDDIMNLLYDDDIHDIDDALRKVKPPMPSSYSSIEPDGATTQDVADVSAQGGEDTHTSSTFETIADARPRNPYQSQGATQPSALSGLLESQHANIISGNSLGEMVGHLQRSGFFVRFEARQQGHQSSLSTPGAVAQRRVAALIVFNPSHLGATKAFIRVAPQPLDTERSSRSTLEREYLFVISGVAERQEPIPPQSFESEWLNTTPGIRINDNTVARTFYASFRNPFCYPIALAASTQEPTDGLPTLTPKGVSRDFAGLDISTAAAPAALQRIISNPLEISGLFAMDRYGKSVSPRKRQLATGPFKQETSPAQSTQQSRNEVQPVVVPPDCTALVRLSFSHVFHRNTTRNILLKIQSVSGTEAPSGDAMAGANWDERCIEFQLPVSILSVIYVNSGLGSLDKAVASQHSPRGNQQVALAMARLSCPARTTIERTLMVPLTAWAFRTPSPQSPTTASERRDRSTTDTQEQRKNSPANLFEFGGVVGVEVNALRAEAMRLFDEATHRRDSDLVNKLRDEEGRRGTEQPSPRSIGGGVLSNSNTRLPPIGASTEGVRASYNEAQMGASRMFSLESDRNYFVLLSAYIDQLRKNLFDVSVEVETKDDGRGSSNNVNGLGRSSSDNAGDERSNMSRGGTPNTRSANMIGLKATTSELPVPLNLSALETSGSSTTSANGSPQQLDRSTTQDDKQTTYNVKALEALLFGDRSSQFRTPLLPTTVVFSPMRQNDPTKCFISLRLRQSTGAKWRFAFMVSSTMPNTTGKSAQHAREFVIHCSSPGVAAASSLSVRSSSGIFEPFTAAFTGHSSQCLAITPLEGVMSPNAPFIFTVECIMSGYGGDVKGTLLIETQTEQWVFPVRGTLG